MIEPLGVPLYTWGGLFALGGVAGLVLGAVARPEGSALPRFARAGPSDVAHFLYGGLAALGGVLAVSLFGALLTPLAAAALWVALLLAGAWWGVPVDRRKGALLAHAKVLAVIAGLVALGYVVTEYVVLR